MRQIGTLTNAADAQRLAAYLRAQHIAASADLEGSAWAIWIRDEDQIAAAREVLAHFQDSPGDERYRDAEARDARRAQEEYEKRRQAQKNTVDIRDRWRTSGGGLNFATAPLTFILIGVSLFVAFLTKLERGAYTDAHKYLLFASPPVSPLSGRPVMIAPDDSWAQIRQGQVWRLATPIFIHFGWTHLLFNMWMLYSLGTRVEAKYRGWKMLLCVLLIAVGSNVAQFLWESKNPYFGGMSGVVYGLFGIAWMCSRFDPGAGIRLDSGTVFILLAWLFLCMAVEIPPLDQTSLARTIGRVANTAHFVGLALGMAIVLVPLGLTGKLFP